MPKFIKKRTFWVNAFLLCVAVLVTIKILNSTHSIMQGIGILAGLLTPFLIGFIIAFLLFVPTRQLEKLFLNANRRFIRKRANFFAILSVYLVVLSVICITLSFVLPILIENLFQFAKQFPIYYDNLLKFIKPYFDKGGILSSFNYDTVKSAVSTQNITKMISMNTVPQIINQLVSIGGGLFKMIIGIVISIYFLADRRHLNKMIENILGTFIKRKHLNTIIHYISKTTNIFYQYIYSMLLDALLVAVLASVGLSILGIPYALVFGCFIGFMNLIPYFGANISGITATVITIFSAGPIAALCCGIFILILLQTDGNVIQPRIIGSQVGIRPLYVILAVTVGGGLFGLPGILISVPFIAVIRMIIIDLLAYRNNKINAVRFAVADNETDENDDTETENFD